MSGELPREERRLMGEAMYVAKQDLTTTIRRLHGAHEDSCSIPNVDVVKLTCGRCSHAVSWSRTPKLLMCQHSGVGVQMYVATVRGSLDSAPARGTRNRLKVRWQWSPYMPGDNVIDCAVESRMGVYDTDSNEILLIKRNIGSPFKAILVLFHELLHYFVHKLRLPQKMHVINDEIWWRVSGG